MNKVGIITNLKDSLYKQQLILELEKKDIKAFNLDEHIFTEFAETQKQIIDASKRLKEKGSDFLIVEDLSVLENFDELQLNSDLIILNPIDTIASYLIGELNRFPLWTMKSTLGLPLLDRFNIGYQVLDRDSKKVFANLLKSETPLELIREEISKYKPFGIDSIILNGFNFANLDPIEDIDIYEINSLYIQKSADILYR